MTRYYKVLKDNGEAQNGPDGFRWSLPTWRGPKHNGRWIPGAWMPVDNPTLCQRGYHACKQGQLVDFLDYGLHIYAIELRGVIVDGNDKVVASEARLLEELPWGADAARFFAVECAADVIHLMKDERSIVALETAFRFACDDATPDELAAAWSAAWSAARQKQTDRLMFWLGEE